LNRPLNDSMYVFPLAPFSEKEILARSLISTDFRTSVLPDLEQWLACLSDLLHRASEYVD